MSDSQRTQLGVVCSAQSRELKRVPIYEPGKDEVLVKNVAVASNPADWKFPAYSRQYAGIDWKEVEGSDFAGYVEEVGEGVTGFKKGDKVAGFSIMAKHSKYGVYQEYTICQAHTLFPLPPGCTFEEASTYGMCFGTAVVCLFKNLELPTPLHPVKPDESFPILIWGASSSVGAFAIQLAKLAGLEVIAVAGNAADYARELGADEVIDYRNKSSTEIIAAINSALGGKGAKVTRVLDAISEPSTLSIISDFLSSKPGPSKLTTVNPHPVTLPEDGRVARLHTFVASVHQAETFQFLGMDVQPNLETAKLWYAWLGREGKEKVAPNRVKVMPGGLNAVDEGLTLLEKGEVSGVKLVYRIDETEGLKK
ncbi:GroES-like protein [Atractiella rhizophila]|nr:GroES-like protein [Atractiella rhizophila]